MHLHVCTPPYTAPLEHRASTTCLVGRLLFLVVAVTCFGIDFGFRFGSAQVLLEVPEVSAWSVDLQGRTALALAAEQGHLELCLLLKVTARRSHTHTHTRVQAHARTRVHTNALTRIQNHHSLVVVFVACGDVQKSHTYARTAYTVVPAG